MKFILATMTLLLACLSAGRAHISYINRDLGAFDPLVTRSVTITSNTVTSDFGWASGTDANLGDSHKLKAFKFTMLSAGTITLKAQGLSFDKSGIPIVALALPGFSVFRGLAHESPALADHDTSVISTQYNDATVGVGNWQGSFRGLADWKIGNDDGATFTDLSSFTYFGHAADGTSVNFGANPGISGDGNADGMVVQTLQLDPGNYSIFVGGARYYDLANSGGDASGSYGFLLTATTIPEPSAGALILVGLALVLRKKSKAGSRQWGTGG